MIAIKQLKEIIGHTADQVSRKKDGSIIARRGYFYRNGQDEQSFKSAVTAKLDGAKVAYEVVEYYDHWAAFRGSAAIAQSSHFAVVFKVKE